MKRILLIVFFITSSLYAVDPVAPLDLTPNGRDAANECREPLKTSASVTTDADRYYNPAGYWQNLCNTAASGYYKWTWSYSQNQYVYRTQTLSGGTSSSFPSGYYCYGGGYRLAGWSEPLSCPAGTIQDENCECIAVPDCDPNTEFLNANNQCEECLDPFSPIGGSCLFDPDNNGVEDPDPTCNYSLCYTGTLDDNGNDQIICSPNCPIGNGQTHPPLITPPCNAPNYLNYDNGSFLCVTPEGNNTVGPDGSTPYEHTSFDLGSGSVAPVENCHTCSDYDFTINGGCFFNEFGGCQCSRTGSQPCPIRNNGFEENLTNKAMQDNYSTSQSNTADIKAAKSLTNLEKLMRTNNKLLEDIKASFDGNGTGSTLDGLFEVPDETDLAGFTGEDTLNDYQGSIEADFNQFDYFDPLGLKQIPASSLPTYSFNIMGSTFTIFEPSMLNGVDMTMIRSIFLMVGALAGFLIVFAGV